MDREKLKRILRQNYYMTHSATAIIALSKYGVTAVWVAEQTELQEGLCDCCKKDLEGVRWCVDHSHETGKTRGVVCFSCNTALRSAEKVKQFVAYLTRYGDLP